MVILVFGAGFLRVPHPFATRFTEVISFDLHVLGMPPAFILSQDQTLHNIYELFVLCTFILKLKLTCSIQFSKTKIILIFGYYIGVSKTMFCGPAMKSI